MFTSEKLTRETLDNLKRNREGRLSSRQWLQLITEPLTTLLLLSVPLILIAGRYGPAGRLIVLALIGAFVLTMAMRALRFARVKLCYRVLYANATQPRWKLWRKSTLASKSGESIRFDHRLSGRLKVEPDQALHAYYIEAGGRRILLTAVPRRHPDAELAEPSTHFERAGGVYFDD
ncbi:MAG: hypothetical protein OXI30_16860 [Chloroflexota bacterium]|nr:hypothetical protein [Chloroflexota bacterium]